MVVRVSRTSVDRPKAADVRMRALYDAHAGAVYRFLLNLTFGDRQLAEDLLQETLVRAWRNLDGFTVEIDRVRPWLMTVARRLAIDAGRARKARPSAVGGDDLSGLPAPDDAIERLLVGQVVRQAFAGLRSDHRRVLVEVYYRGRTIQETADILGIPEGTVKSRSYHALRSLRAILRSSPAR
jgi:RNA polymerase sigma-70 factor (ECF subfamily)